MQGLPTPPTDNLYKFIAIAGIAMIVGGLMAATLHTQGDHEWYQSSADRLIQRRHDALVDKTLSKSDADTLWEQEVAVFANEIKARERLAKFIGPALAIAIVLGGLLIPIGFWMWWNKFQKFQDRLIQLECEQAELEHQRAKTAQA